MCYDTEHQRVLALKTLQDLTTGEGPLRYVRGLLLGLFMCGAVVSCFGDAGVSAAAETGEAVELQSSLQSSEIRQGDFMTVTASVVKAQLVLNSPEVIRYLKMSAYVMQPDGSGYLKALFDNGMDGDVSAGDGVYSCRFAAAQAGDYSVRVLAEGKGFRRTREHSFKTMNSGHAEETAVQEQQGLKVQAKTEVGKKSPQKFSWITFAIINAVAAVFWLSGSVLLYLRKRTLGPARIEKKVMDFGRFIRAQAEEKMKQLASDEKKEQEGATADAKVINELQSARFLFLKGLLEEPKKAGEEMPVLWTQIYKSFNEALKTVLKAKKTALDEIDVLQEKVEEIGGISEELKGARALAEAQAKKISFLMSFKDVIAEAQQKFDSVKKKNRDLEQKLFDAAHAAGLGDVMKQPLAEFKENYHQLELCVATLEGENDRLVEELGRWKKELDQMKKQGPVMISETPAEVLKENEDLKELVRGLEELIKTKEKEIAEAFQRFESLESEYMVLYHEKQAAQQQPDI